MVQKAMRCTLMQYDIRNGLVRGTILADTNGIMSTNSNDPETLKRRHTRRWSSIEPELEESRADAEDIVRTLD